MFVFKCLNVCTNTNITFYVCTYIHMHVYTTELLNKCKLTWFMVTNWTITIDLMLNNHIVLVISMTLETRHEPLTLFLTTIHSKQKKQILTNLIHIEKQFNDWPYVKQPYAQTNRAIDLIVNNHTLKPIELFKKGITSRNL